MSGTITPSFPGQSFRQAQRGRKLGGGHAIDHVKVGSNSITIDNTGVTIKGMMVSIQGQMQLDMKGAMTSVNGDGILTLKGSITMIN